MVCAPRGAGRHHAEARVRYRDIDFRSVGRRSPLHAAERAAVADARLPEDGSAAVRIDGGDDAGFLSGDQRAFSIRKADQDRRRAEIEIRPPGRGAVRAHRRTRHVEGVAGRDLPRPRQLPGCGVERQDGIRHAGRRVRVIVAGGHVQHVLRPRRKSAMTTPRRRTVPSAARRRCSSRRASAPRRRCSSSTASFRSMPRARRRCRGSCSRNISDWWPRPLRSRRPARTAWCRRASARR